MQDYSPLNFLLDLLGNAEVTVLWTVSYKKIKVVMENWDNIGQCSGCELWSQLAWD